MIVHDPSQKRDLQKNQDANHPDQEADLIQEKEIDQNRQKDLIPNINVILGLQAILTEDASIVIDHE